MTVEIPNGLETFADVDAFYAANEKRRTSGEADYGIYWWDGEQGYSDTWRVSAVAATGEIYIVRDQPHRRDSRRGDVVLLGKVADSDLDYKVSDRVLEGWNLQCGAGHSLQWVIDQVHLYTQVAQVYAPISFLLRHAQLGGHVHVDVFSGRTPGSRGRAGELVFREEEWPVFRDALQMSLGGQLELVERTRCPDCHALWTPEVPLCPRCGLSSEDLEAAAARLAQPDPARPQIG